MKPEHFREVLHELADAVADWLEERAERHPRPASARRRKPRIAAPLPERPPTDVERAAARAELRRAGYNLKTGDKT